jgi:DNA-binding response OmpR family regulator
LHEEDREKEKDLTLIIALSGLITEQIVSKGTACGFDDFIETPLTIDKI